MAKAMKQGGGKMKARTIGGAGGNNKGKVAFPNQGQPSNVIADKQAKLLFMGLLTGSFVLIAAGMFWAAAQFIASVNQSPIGYLGIAASVICVVVLLFIARAMLWLSIFASLMFAQKSNAWDAQLFLCEQAMKLKKLIPGGASTAGLLLVQGYINRGEIEETIKIGQQQHDEFGRDPKQVQNLAPMYSTLGLAFHMQGAWRESVIWNDRAIEAFAKILEQFAQKKGIAARLVGSQTEEWMKNVHTQLAVTCFNNGTNHFNLRNQRSAKESYRQAVEHANKAPDFPEKADLLKVSREQLSRLKHA